MDWSQLLNFQKVDVDQAIGITGNPVALAKAIGPELQINAGPLGPSGVMPMLTPFFCFSY